MTQLTEAATGIAKMLEGTIRIYAASASSERMAGRLGKLPRRHPRVGIISWGGCSIKKAILRRKNALFRRTQNGAQVGNLFRSLIHTAELSDVNPPDSDRVTAGLAQAESKSFR